MNWSFYFYIDKVVKDVYLGIYWKFEDLKVKWNVVIEKFWIIINIFVMFELGVYCVYLVFVVLEEFILLFGWGGFSVSNFEIG